MDEKCYDILDLTKTGWCSCGTPDPLDHIDECTVNLPADIIDEVEQCLTSSNTTQSASFAQFVT